MSDLTTDEQVHVRTALRFLRTRSGSWDAVAKMLQLTKKSLSNFVYGQPPSGGLAIRLARLVGVPVDDVLTGKYPLPGTCPYCGHRPEPGEAAVAVVPADR